MTSASALVSAYFEGDLDPDEYAHLRAWLLESSKHVDEFVRDAFVHTQLIDLVGPEQVRANRLVAAELVPKAAPHYSVPRSMGRMLALAASLMFVVVLVSFFMLRPAVVATVTGTRNVQWALGAEKRAVGGLLQSGDEVAVDRGTLHLTFARGGQVALHGPARFRLESDNAGRLLGGSLSAFVLEHAVGFTIHSGRLWVVDLGTEFQIELLTDDSCELQVFDGLVEVQFREPDSEGAGGKLQISQGRAFRFDGRSGKIQSIEYDKTKRLPVSVWSQ